MRPVSVRSRPTAPAATIWFLPLASSFVAGIVDVMSFVLLHGLFTAHITGNLVVLGADLALSRPMELAPVLAIPVFVVVTAALAVVVDRSGRPPWRWTRDFLVLQSAFLTLAFVAAVTTRESIAVALLAVAAMATQNALLHLTLRNAPSTAVMTGNTVAATIALVGLALQRGTRTDSGDRTAWGHLWPLLLGFALGCLVGAGTSGALHAWAWMLPAVLSAALAVAATHFDLPPSIRRAS